MAAASGAESNPREKGETGKRKRAKESPEQESLVCRRKSQRCCNQRGLGFNL